MEVNWGAVQRWLGALLADRGVMDIAAEELTVPPGMDELFSLLQIKRHHESGQFDVVIVDCAPTGETLRLLGFPDIAHWWLEKVFPWERRLVGAAKPLARMIDVELPGEDVLAEVQRLVRQMIAMNEILRDRDHASIRLVMNPDRMVIKEAQRTFTYLNLYGYLTDAVIVNRIFPDELAGGYFGEWRERQRRRLAEVRDGFAPVPVLTARYFDEEVIGPRMLDRLAAELFDAEHDPAAVMHTELAQELESANGTRDPADRRPVRREGRRRPEEGRRRADRLGRPAQANYHPARRARPPQRDRRQARRRLARGQLRDSEHNRWPPLNSPTSASSCARSAAAPRSCERPRAPSCAGSGSRSSARRW